MPPSVKASSRAGRSLRPAGTFAAFAAGFFLSALKAPSSSSSEGRVRGLVGEVGEESRRRECGLGTQAATCRRATLPGKQQRQRLAAAHVDAAHACGMHRQERQHPPSAAFLAGAFLAAAAAFFLFACCCALKSSSSSLSSAAAAAALRLAAPVEAAEPGRRCCGFTGVPGRFFCKAAVGGARRGKEQA